MQADQHARFSSCQAGGRRAWLALGAALLTGCGEPVERGPDPGDLDPALVAALESPLMVDPDLRELNDSGAGIVVAGPDVIALPVLDRSPETIAAIKAEAIAALDAPLEPAPPARAANPADAAIRGAITAGQLAEAADAPCADRVRYSARWAAGMTAPLDIYPRGAVIEAAGVEDGACRLRVIRFQTPVDLESVLAFYVTGVRSASFTARRSAAQGVHVLWGGRPGAAYLLRGRVTAEQLTEIDLVVSGV